MSIRDDVILEYARCENIAAFTRQLQGELDLSRRTLLLTLLSEQQAHAPRRPPSTPDKRA